MNTHQNATQAYAAASRNRSLREQEADVFRHANLVLKRAREAGGGAEARAIADNDRLWSLVLDLVRDPTNTLPVPLRTGIVSIGLAVRRELRHSAPNLDFVSAVNETIAKGLAGLPE